MQNKLQLGESCGGGERELSVMKYLTFTSATVHWCSGMDSELAVNQNGDHH